MGKTILLVIVVLIFQNNFTAKAQTEGFLGKRHQLQYDAFGTVYQGIFGFTYSYAVSKHFMLQGSFGIQSKSYDVDFTSTNEGNNNIINSSLTSHINASRFALSFLWNGSEAGLNLPVGYYSGFSLKYMTSNVVNTVATGKMYSIDYYDYNTNTNSGYQLNNTPLNFNAKVKSYGITWVFGKNYYLDKNITLDLAGEFGFAYYSFDFYNAQSTYNTSNSYTTTNDSRGYIYQLDDVPTPFYDFIGKKIATQIFNPFKSVDGTNVTNQKYYYITKIPFSTDGERALGFRLIFIPSIKLGYIF